MAIPRYDVLKRDCGGLLWIEAIDDLESAKLRVQQLRSASYGEYFVFDQNTGQTVHTCAVVRDARSEKPR